MLAVLFSGSVLITLPRTQHSQLYVGAGLVVAIPRGLDRARHLAEPEYRGRADVGATRAPGSRWSARVRRGDAAQPGHGRGGAALDHRLLLRTTAWASANWVLDAASLWVFVAAFGHRLNVDELLVAYGFASLIGGLPITPAGLGVIEGFLIPALVGLGTPAATATLGVLAWRAASFGLPRILVGGLSYLSLKVGPWALPTKPEPGRSS